MTRAGNAQLGFTLIELLIVIAIIGILASVLIPQLLGARLAANKKALQVHSSHVYKVASAIAADDIFLDRNAIAIEAQLLCKQATRSLVILGKTYQYGWSKPPETFAGCTVTASANDFTVSVLGNANADSKTSVNGQNLL